MTGLPTIVIGGLDLVPFLISFVLFFALYVAISLTLNIEFGLTGIPNFGKVLFIAAGAAFGGSLSGRLASYLLLGPTKGDYIDQNPTIILNVNTMMQRDLVGLGNLWTAVLAVVVVAAGVAVLLWRAKLPKSKLQAGAGLLLVLLGTYMLFELATGLTTDFFVGSLVNGFSIFAIELVVITFAIAAAVGAILGYVVSFPAIRLREDYLGMLLLASAQFFQIVLKTYKPLIGGVYSIEVPDPFIFWSSVQGLRDLAAAVAMSVFAILVYLYAERVAKSPLARTLRAVRENEDAARALGKDDVSMRRNVLIIASAIASVGGALWTFYIGSVEYDTWGRVAWTFWPFVIVIIGGVGNNLGVVLGALFFSLIFKGLLQIQPLLQSYVQIDANFLGDIIFAALLIAILMIRPDGILREKSAPTLSKSTLRSIVGMEPTPEVGRKSFRSRIVGVVRKVVDQFRSSPPSEKSG